MKKLLEQVRGRFKKVFDRISNEKLKQNFLQALPFWIGSVFTGLIAVLYAKLFGWAENGTAYIMHHHRWWLFVLTPVCFVLAWWITARYAKYARGSGIPQVIAAIELANPQHRDKVGKLLSLRIIVVKIISSLIMVFGGGIVGREGPTIQIAGSVFHKIKQWLPAWWPKVSHRNMIMAGAAAGLAAAFNTPLGGIVFAVEELTKLHISYFKTALFTAVIIAGLTAQWLLGPYLYLGYPDVNSLSFFVFGGVICVAIVAGLCGSYMSKLMLALMGWKSKFKTPGKQVLYIIACALIVVVLAVFVNEKMLGSGKELMTQTLFTPNKTLEWYMPLMRMGGSILSFTTGGAGGVFAPSLSAGASIGAVLAGWFHVSPADANLLILAGMVAFLTGVTRTPFTSAILVLEMTDRHNVIFHLMLAGMVASLVSILIDKHSFYDRLKHQYIKELGVEEEPEKEEEDEDDEPEIRNENLEIKNEEGKMPEV
ncbi:MAG: chloride channel protein [Chitinophagaceae bacterium]